MKSCDDCVHCKWYPYRQAGPNAVRAYCSGVILDDKQKKCDWIEDLSQANQCDFYDTDSWVK